MELYVNSKSIQFLSKKGSKVNYLVVTQVEGHVNRPERLKINVNLFLLPLVGDDCPTVNDQTVRWHCQLNLITAFR